MRTFSSDKRFTVGREELEKNGFHIGDFIAFDTNTEVNNGFINSRHLDNKAGVASMLAAAKAIQDSGAHIPVTVHLLFTISEEVGIGASAILHGDVAEMVAVDNATPAPGQNSRERGVTVSMMDSTGPFDCHLTHKLLDLCQKFGFEHQRDVFKYYRCDAASALEAGNDMRVALVCFGADASHGYERTHQDALVSPRRAPFSVHAERSDLRTRQAPSGAAGRLPTPAGVRRRGRAASGQRPSICESASPTPAKLSPAISPAPTTTT